VTSSRYGIVRSITEMVHRPGNALIHVVSAATGEVDGVVTGGSPVIGSGANIAHDAAVRSAIGEVLERYSAKWVQPKIGVTGSYLDLREPAPHPAGFALFHESQYSQPGFPFAQFLESTVVTWVPAVELASGVPSWLPGQLVYLHHEPASREKKISYSTSSGLACASTYEGAALNALLEAIERDAAMLAWYLQYSPPAIDISADEELSRIQADRFTVEGVHHLALDLSAIHGIPSVLVLVEDDDPSAGGAAFGSACALDPRVAWLKALTEAYHTRLWALDLRRRRSRAVHRPWDVRSLEDHVAFYAVPEHSRFIDFLRNPGAAVAIDRLPSWRSSSASDAVDALSRALQSSGVSAYATDVTPPDVLDAGFRVVRVVCPELCRLDVAYRARHLGGERLLTMAAELGLADRRLELDDLNPYPHPFP
jgi:ribosomal protein S12 methylthiotransferase accessory factor